MLKYANKQTRETKKLMTDYLNEFDEVIRVQLEQCVSETKRHAKDATHWADHVEQYAEIVKDSAQSDGRTIERAQWHAKWAKAHAKYAETTVEAVNKGNAFTKDIVTIVKAHAKNEKAEKYIAWVKDSVECIKEGAQLVEHLTQAVKENSDWAKSYAEDAIRSTKTHGFDPTVEIRKYKALLDDGIMTEDEFDQKKTELLRVE
ncbi:MAG: SHOCT domain-containing protein [Defluviitaleaceae bacterium]|nr:SHOCT domain-containing protein [Defluviitaleaceae bacterium]